MRILYGKPVREKILSGARATIQAYDLKPKLVILTAKNYDMASSVYIKNKIKTCEEVGIEVEVVELKWDNNRHELLDDIQKKCSELNKDDSVDGYFIQMPLPFNLKISDFADFIDVRKDIDCFSATSLGRSFNGTAELTACTPTAIMESLDFYNIGLEGKNVVIINRSQIVGLPLIPLLLNKNATVQICHSKTYNLKDTVKNADVIITAIGQAEYFKAEDFKEDAIVYDISMNRDDKGLCGDVERDVEVTISPSPKGIGLITTAMVIRNVVRACLKRKFY